MKKIVDKIFTYPLFALIPIFFLLIPIISAVFFPYDDIPYFYFILLRLIVCAFSIYFSIRTYNINQKVWPWVFGSIAILFNPLFQIHMEENDWLAIDVIVSVIFLIAILRLKANPFSAEKIVLTFVGIPAAIALILSLIAVGVYLYKENFTVVSDKYPPTKNTKYTVKRTGYAKLGKCEKVKCTYTDDGICTAFRLDDVLRCTDEKQKPILDPNRALTIDEFEGKTPININQ